jgi:hypothetical protein
MIVALLPATNLTGKFVFRFPCFPVALSPATNLTGRLAALLQLPPLIDWSAYFVETLIQPINARNCMQSNKFYQCIALDRFDPFFWKSVLKALRTNFSFL